MRPEPITVNISDLGVVAALVTCNFEIADTYSDKSGRIYFTFQETEAFDDVVNAFYTDTLDVKARKYFDTIKTLKGRFYANK